MGLVRSNLNGRDGKSDAAEQHVGFNTMNVKNNEIERAPNRQAVPRWAVLVRAGPTLSLAVNGVSARQSRHWLIGEYLDPVTAMIHERKRGLLATAVLIQRHLASLIGAGGRTDPRWLRSNIVVHGTKPIAAVRFVGNNRRQLAERMMFAVDQRFETMRQVQWQ